MKAENFQTRFNSVYSVFIVVANCIISIFFFFSFLKICFIPGYPYNFRYLVIVCFTVYDIIFVYIYIYITQYRMG